MQALRRSITKKLSQTRVMVNEFDEAMDYVTHCTLQGFAEGLAFALDEIEEAIGQEAGEKKRGPKKGRGE